MTRSTLTLEILVLSMMMMMLDDKTTHFPAIVSPTTTPAVHKCLVFSSLFFLTLHKPLCSGTAKMFKHSKFFCPSIGSQYSTWMMVVMFDASLAVFVGSHSWTKICGSLDIRRVPLSTANFCLTATTLSLIFPF